MLQEIQSTNNRERVVEYLKHNTDYIRYIVKPHIETKRKSINENYIFSNEVEEQFYTLVKYIIVNEVCKATALDYESVIVEVEDINLKLYIGESDV